MRTGGRLAHYTVQKGFVKKKRLSLATIRKARTATSLSGNQTEKFVSILRNDLDADAVEPGLHRDIAESNNILEDFFRQESVSLEAKTESLASKQKRLAKLEKEVNELAETASKSLSQAPSAPLDSSLKPSTDIGGGDGVGCGGKGT